VEAHITVGFGERALVRKSQRILRKTEARASSQETVALCLDNADDVIEGNLLLVQMLTPSASMQVPENAGNTAPTRSHACFFPKVILPFFRNAHAFF
jgi:hypothetical protein